VSAWHGWAQPLAPHTYGLHAIGAGAWQVPSVAHVPAPVAVPIAHVAVPHAVPAVAALHWPEPLQLPGEHVAFAPVPAGQTPRGS
jgi:hypothetical protein